MLVCKQVGHNHTILDHSKYYYSTGICGSLTAGQGKLDMNV